MTRRIRSAHRGGRHHGESFHSHRGRPCRGVRVRGTRGRAGADRSVVLLSGCGGRSDHEDHRRLRGRFRKGKFRHQAQADLFGKLSGVAHQGADCREGGRPAGDVDPALDRHVHTDRRGRDRAVRRSREDRRRSCVARELLSGVHGKQPDRRQDVGHSVPALDDRPLLQQGAVQGSGTRPQQAAGDLEGNDRVRREADQARCIGQGDAMGCADSRRRAFRTGFSRHWPSRTART